MSAALLLVGFGVAPMVFLPTGEPLVAWVRDPQWMALNLAALAMALLLPFALVAIYGLQAKEIGRVGTLGFLGALVGSSLYLALQFEETFVWPVLSVHAPELLDVRGPMFTDPAFSAAYLAMGVLFMVGWLVFAASTTRAGVFPRSGGLLLCIGMPLFGAGAALPPGIRSPGSVAAGLGLAVLARAMWLGVRPRPPAHEP